MRIRRIAALSLVVLVLASCANNAGSSAAAPSPSGLPGLSTPSAAADETISGTVSAGVEPHCLVLQNATGDHVLIFDDPSLKASVPAGAQVTLVGHAEPRMMTTCQQGVAFIVTSVRKG